VKLLPVALAAMLSIVVVGDAHAISMERAVLQGLDKTTARVSRFEAKVGGTVDFGSLKIELKACDKRPPEETPESAAFLKIIEQKPGEAPAVRFSGWMFASSPALSAMEHPVYDIWVLDCISGEETGQPAGEGEPAGASSPTQEPAVETTD
jgi:hypothetical protein